MENRARFTAREFRLRRVVSNHWGNLFISLNATGYRVRVPERSTERCESIDTERLRVFSEEDLVRYEE